MPSSPPPSPLSSPCSPTTASPSARVRVWDLPTRLFHWLLVVSVTGALVTVQLGGLYMDWHVRFGLLTLGLLLFRLAWGFCGPHYARFAQFLRGPSTVLAYLRGQIGVPAGHNPLGAWAVLAMLLALSAQVITGLFANDDILTAGPLAGLVSSKLSSTLTWLHGVNATLIYALLTLHLTAVIVWYALIRRHRLIAAMISGDADAPADTLATTDNARIWLRALLVAMLAGAFVWLLLALAPPVVSSYY